VQLQRSLPDIQRAGLGLVAVSYDSVDTLRAFADKHGITFPLLSDPGSKTIAAWGILNREATGRTAGIPYPGTYVLDPKGVIVSRNFEDAYQERDTAASIIAALRRSSPPSTSGASGSEVLGTYLKLGLDNTDPIAAPGHRITLTVDVTPGPKVHVYAPGQANYMPVALTMKDSPDWKAAAAVLPRPIWFVDPLGERVQVYDRPFRITEQVTLTLTPSMRQRATARDSLVVAGALAYQACDDKICYRPETIPVQWTIALTPIEP
jgi:hypothetical protein